MSGEVQRQFAIDVAQKLTSAGFEAYWAGGCVRDQLLGLQPKDYDIATNARPVEVRELFGRRRTLAVGESFGVVVVLSGNKQIPPVEVATFRTDGDYSDGRHPDTVEFCTAEEDAKRRDFTINGMFFDPLTESVLDYVGGRDDLASGIVRAIGDPTARMTEDKLRMLRAVRFAARFAFALEDATAKAIREMAPQLEVVSQERIAQELRLILASDTRPVSLDLLQTLGLLFVAIPQLEAIWSTDYANETRRLFEAQDLRSFELALAILLRDVNQHRGDSSPRRTLAAEICRTLKLSNGENETITWLIDHQQALNAPQDLPLCELKPLLVHKHTHLLLEWVRIQDTAFGREPSRYEFCREYLKATSPSRLNPDPLVTGEDLKRAGLKPGPDFARHLQTIRNAQLDETIHTREEGLKLIGLPDNSR